MYQYTEYLRDGPFWSGLRDRGYKLEKMAIGTKSFIRCTSPAGNTYLTSTVSYPMNSVASRFIAEQKNLAYKLVAALGGRIPSTKAIIEGQESEALDMLQQLGAVVVKPVDSFGSRGVTCEITDKIQLMRALTDAREYSREVIVQEQVEGEEVRFSVLNGKVVSVILRQAPHVIGDGVSTVAQLIQQENTKRRSLKHRYISYPQLTESLIRSDDINDTVTILAEGEKMPLSRATSIKFGASMYEVMPDTHLSYIDMAEHLVRAMGGGFVAVDMFVANYTKDMDDNDYWFNEFNTSPALALYYANRSGDSSYVADSALNDFDMAVNFREKNHES